MPSLTFDKTDYEIKFPVNQIQIGRHLKLFYIPQSGSYFVGNQLDWIPEREKGLTYASHKMVVEKKGPEFLLFDT